MSITRSKLKSRDEFRNGVFERDNYTCKLCGATDVKLDAHHIMERRLFRQSHEHGGYFINNGITVCEPCHMLCEQTVISVEDCLAAIGLSVQHRVTPDHLYPDHVYTKWGDAILEDGTRSYGELFSDASVQKVLKSGNMLKLYVNRVKYPRTKHLPWSPGINDDDKVLRSLEHFANRRVIVTEKMDGENTTMYYDYIHARSIDNRRHPSRDWVKNFWNENVAYQIPETFRICGENLYAEHSIGYKELPTYFMGFSVWDRMTCMSWDDTVLYLSVLGIQTVPVIYDGIFDVRMLRDLEFDTSKQEGYVVRVAESFDYADFHTSVAKYVRAGHVQTTKHNWMTQEVKPNEIRKEAK